MSAKHKRWSTDPIIGKDGTPVAAQINARREKLLRFMLRINGPVTIDEMHAYMGGSHRALHDAVNVLVASNNAYLRFADHTLRKRVRTEKDAYVLDNAGKAYLSRKGEHIVRPTSSFNYDHAKLATHVTTSLEVGIERAERARLIAWGEILKSSSLPEKTREGELAGIPVTYATPDGEVLNKIVFADSKPFGIELTHDGRPRRRFFPGIEADMGTEPITTANFHRTSLFSKFLAYLAIENDQIYKAHFGFPNMYVPFVFNDPARMKTALQVLYGMGTSKNMIFQLAREDAPSGYMFTAEWLRAGHEPINLSK